ncbi:MAG TPA: RHS repeat-associated core domain-containing protein [Candidatus Acidoferrum sp.]|nr:RHS repeat-associated core domain-containing protein [Candidatus Acidoferrum sp.]
MLAHNRGSIREFARVFVSILLVSLLSPGPDWQAQAKAGPVSRPPVHAALAGAFPAVSIPIQLTASTVPSQGEAGVNLVYVTGSGFPSGTIPPINVTVSFAATCGGAPLANATATGVQTLLGTTRRVQVQIPSGLTPNTYAVSLNGTTSTGTSFSSVNCSSVQVIPLATLTLTPNSGNPGSTVAVTISRSNPGFVQGSTVASFGAGTSVGGAADGALGPVTVVSPTSATAQVTINGNAAGGVRTTLVATGSEQLLSSFTITSTANPPVLQTVNPNTGQQGQTNESVNLTGQFTHWVQGTSTASFGAGITVASLTVNTATTATAVVNIDAAAAAGARNVSVTTGAETVSLANAFTVTQPVGGPAILSLTPNSALPGQAIQVLITAQNTHFVQGITQFNFGPQISVGGGPASGYGPVQVTSATTATAQVSVPNNAVVGSRTVVVQTGSEQANLVSGFVVHGTPVLSSLTPSSAQKGQTLVVTIHGTATNFQQGVSQANFGAGISVGGALAGGFGPISVTGPTTATAQIAIDAAAAVGLRTPVTVQTGVEQASLSNSGFLVLGPVIGSAPVVTITSPTEGAEVTAPTTVTGTVTSPNLSNWILEYQASASTIFTQFAAGTSATVSGTLDPSLLLNGIAQIRLTGVDQSGQTATIIVNVVVTRNVKVGNFTLSFNDLTVPVAGIPIQVIRTYDSRVKSSGDFGFGWSLSIKTTKVDVNGVLGQNWTGTKSSGFLPTYCIVPAQNYVVSIRLQGGTIYQFQPTLTSATQCSLLTPPTFVDMAFTPIGATPANATLTAPIATGLFVLGSFPGPVQLLDFDTVMPVDPDQFILTLPTGQQLTVSRTFGIQSIKDTNANTLTFSSTGITSSTGKGVIFARDAQNRITTITDPMAHVLTYNYNASGDLTTFTDQISNVSTFTYDGNHNLLSFKDPSGNQPVRSVYDDSGRLIQEIDAFGHVINLTNTPGSSSETVTDALGNPTTFVYDAHGNVLSKTDALGNLTTFTYNANDHLTSRTNALGKTYNYTYDANGNRLTEADPLGNISTYTYNSLSQIATFKDANGNFATSNTFDASGNQLTATDPLGHTKTIAYGANGRINSSVDLNGKTVSFTYDAGGNLASQTDTAGTVTNYTVDANGNRLSQTITRTTPSGPQVLTTQYQYDSMNRVVKITSPDGSTSQTSYNPIGKKASTTDGLGRVTTFQYDASGQLIQTNYPDGTRELTNYDANGRRIQFTSRSNATTSFTYDALGRMISTTDALGNTTSKTYDAIGQVISTTDPLGNVTSTTYDVAGRALTVTDAKGGVTTYTYDAVGNRLTATDPNGHTTSYQYDVANDVTKVTYPDGTFQTTVYDNLGKVLSKTDAAGKTTQYSYDALGRLVSVTDALAQVTKHAYDEVGNLISQTDANNHTTTFAYDQRGHRISRTLPGGQSENFAYDNSGNMTSHTDFNGKITTYTYDTLNHLLSKTPDASFHASPVTFTYTTSGLRATMTDPSGTSTYQYDSANRLVQVVKPNGTLSYSYDPAGNLISLNSGALVAYTYDQLNRLASVSDPTTGITSYSYDAVGNLTSVAYPNGVVHAYAYNTKNQLTNLGINKGALHLASYASTLDAVGHRLTVAELSGRTVNYAYDNSYRLTSEGISGDPNGQNGTVSYTFDSVSNRLQRSSTLAAIPAGLLSYDANDRLSTDTYDPNGNTLSSAGLNNIYDFENRLISHTTTAGTVTIVYDGDGNRVSKTVGGVTTKYLVDDLNPTGLPQVVRETISGNNTRTFVYGLDRISQTQFLASSGTTVTSFYVYDGHGSVRALADATGAATDAYDYDAFGNLIHSVGTTQNEFLFAGEQFDTDLGYFYSRARYYNAFTGRFITTDPLDGDPESPISLHRYLYANADPINNSDPTGLQDLIDISISLAIDSTLTSISAGLTTVGVLSFVAGVFGGITYQQLPPGAFLKLPDAALVGYTVLANVGKIAGKFATSPVAKGIAAGLSLLNFGGGVDILYPFHWPNQLWIYGYVGVNISWCIGCGDKATNKFKAPSGFGDTITGSAYVGAAYETPTAGSYAGPFFCFGAFGSFAKFLPRFPLTPDVTVCSSAPSGTSPGAYTWTKSVNPTNGPSFGFTASYTYYTEPYVTPNF